MTPARWHIDGTCGMMPGSARLSWLSLTRAPDLPEQSALTPPDLGFQQGDGTANAVWVRAHPGFKSPSLRLIYLRERRRGAPAVSSRAK